ncbi:MAG TPA: hypothetical protein VNA69_11555 [Thermoanaerobaculia bacterium]|nr:hypothetical protein [Thermoanaerobaculia bacterium]
MFCYDSVLREKRMRLRAAVAALFVAVVSVPRVASAAEVVAGRWHATAVPPRPGLPVVEIDLGYPGLYVPAANAPADFRARTGEQPFDGYIGYHIASGEQKTLDTPVVARAVLGPHSQWTFSTPMHLFLGMAAWHESFFRRREVVIEWRDRERNVIAKRSVGVPPWLHETRVLRIVRSHADPASALSFGEKTVRIDASSLSDSPQWYGGFSSIIVPTDLWFELPDPVRAAIFRSAVAVVFVGIPQRMPPMQAIDRALLPIELRSEPGTVKVPWPYHDGQPRVLPVAMSWRAKSGADVLGAQTSPYFVANSIATFAAEERALQDPLPSFEVVIPRKSEAESHMQLPTMAEILRDYRPALALVLFAMLSIAAWLVIRRSPRLTILGICVAVTLLAIGWRDAIRPAAEQHTYERVTMVAPGVIDILTTRHDSGHSPRTIAPAEIAAARMDHVIRGAVERAGDDVEVRAPRTPAGFGELHRPGRPWVATWRVTKRRELGTPATIRVRARDAKRLVVEYDSATPVNYIAAAWLADGIRYYGETHVRSRRGVATVAALQQTGAGLFFWARMHQIWDLDTTPRQSPIALLHVERHRTVMVRHIDELAPSRARYSIITPLRPNQQGRLSALLVLPAPAADGATVQLSIPGGPAQLNSGREAPAITISGRGGIARLQPSAQAPYGAELSASEALRIAPEGGLVKVDVETSSPEAAPVSVQLRVGRNRT